MLSFTYPLFLGLGLAALSAPVILHLMNRAVPKRLVFPSIRLIRKARLPREGRRRLRDLLLLLLRLLGLAAAVLALSQPLYRGTVDVVGVDAPQNVVVILDASASMGGWEQADAARTLARELTDAVPGNSRIAILVSSNRILAESPFEVGRDGVRQVLRDYRVQPLPGNHSAALRKASLLLGAQGIRKLILISDFQNSDWQGYRDSTQFDSGVEIEFHPVGPQERENVGIVGVNAMPLGNDTTQLVVEVRNFSSHPLSRTLRVNSGDEEEAREVDLPALRNRRLAFVCKTTGNEMVARLAPDAYAADDEYHAWTGALPPVEVALVAPLRKEPQSANARLFLRQALTLQDERDPLHFSVEEISADMFMTADLSKVRTLFLLGATGYFEDVEFGMLSEFLAKGGVVVMTPGLSVARGLHELWRRDFMRLRYLGEAGKNSNQDLGLGWIDEESSLGKIFGAADETDLFLFPIRRYARVSLPADAKPLLRTISGDPALVELPSGKGRIFFCALGFDPGFSDLPLSQSFLPLVRELALAGIPPGYGILNLDCGESLPQLEALGDKSPDLLKPAAFLLGNRPVCLNVARSESALERINLYDLKLRLQPEAVSGTAGEPGIAASSPVLEHELWPWFALLAALALFAEFALASLLDQRELRGRG